MIKPVRKAKVFAEGAIWRLEDPSYSFAEGEMDRIAREGRVLLFGATPDEQADLWQIISAAEDRIGNLDAALDAAERACAAAPDSPYALNNLGKVLGRMGRRDEALSRFREAEALSGEDRTSLRFALGNQAIAHRKLGDDAKAIEVYRRAQEAVAGENPSDLLWLAIAAAQLDLDDDVAELVARSLSMRAGRDRGEGSALDVIDRLTPSVVALSTLPSSVITAIDRARALEAARVRSEAAIPEPLAVLLSEAESLVPGDPRHASKAIRRAAAAAGTNVTALRRLSALAARLGHEDDATELLARAIVAVSGPRNRRLALEVVRSAPERLVSALLPSDEVRTAVAAVAARYDVPMPARLAVATEAELSPEEWDRFAGLAHP